MMILCSNDDDDDHVICCCWFIKGRRLRSARDLMLNAVSMEDS